MSIQEQCRLLKVPRSSFYHRPRRDPQLADEVLIQVIDRIFLEEPTFGTHRMMDALAALGYKVGRDRVRRLIREMGIEPIYPKPRLSTPGKGHKRYPYLLRGLDICRPNQVWCTDITYIPMGSSHVYLVAVMDWFSRKVLSWRLSNTLDTSFCIEALEEAIERYGCPEIFNNRPRLPVHQRRLHGRAQKPQNPHLNGRQRSRPGQPHDRTALAQRQIRRHLYPRL